VRPDGVVVPAPTLNEDPGFCQCVKDLAVEQFVPELAIEALVVAVLPWAARFDEQCLHANPRQPFPHRDGGELTAIVGTDVIRWAMPGEQIRQHMQDIVMPQAARNLDRQALAGKLIDHREHADRSTIMRAVLYEVVGPDMVAPDWSQTDARPVVEP